MKLVLDPVNQWITHWSFEVEGTRLKSQCKHQCWNTGTFKTRILDSTNSHIPNILNTCDLMPTSKQSTQDEHIYQERLVNYYPKYQQ